MIILKNRDITGIRSPLSLTDLNHEGRYAPPVLEGYPGHCRPRAWCVGSSPVHCGLIQKPTGMIPVGWGGGLLVLLIRPVPRPGWPWTKSGQTLASQQPGRQAGPGSPVSIGLIIFFTPFLVEQQLPPLLLLFVVAPRCQCPICPPM